MGIHAAIKADRYEAMVPLHQACRIAFGSVGAAIAGGLKLRHDRGSGSGSAANGRTRERPIAGGSRFISRAYQAEVRFLGMEPSPSFVRAPEGNGCIERFWRILKEQFLWIRTFADLDDLNQALQEFRLHSNQHWLIQRHNRRPPSQVRQDLLGQGAAA